MDERKRDSIVAYLRRRMAEFDITPEALSSSIAEDLGRLRAVKYRDAFGNTWDGKGAAPQWVIKVTSTGQSLEHFAVNGETRVPTDTRASVDWREDPFAGSRLATVKLENHAAP